jgi:hypothetical protein
MFAVNSLDTPHFPKSDIGISHAANFLDYVIRRFNLPSARLNKPQGLNPR